MKTDTTRPYTKYEYYLEMARVTKRIGELTYDNILKTIYINVSKGFIEKSLNLTTQDACKLATEEEMKIFYRYEEKLIVKLAKAEE